MHLERYKPAIKLSGLQPGVDNVRHDVTLSPRFYELMRTHVSWLLERHGNVEDMARETGADRRPAYERAMGQKAPDPKTPSEIAAQFKQTLTTLQLSVLRQARTVGVPSLDLLFRLSLLRLFRVELGRQYAAILERCRAKLRGAAVAMPGKSIEMRERLQRFQVNKRTIWRRAAQELLATVAEVEKEHAASMRRSLLGERDEPAYAILQSHLALLEDTNDDQLNADHYVMLGNFAADPDRYDVMVLLARKFLHSLGVVDDDEVLGEVLNAPQNAGALLGEHGAPDSSKSRAQKALLEGWVELLEKHDVMNRILAAYEVVPLLSEFAVINPQQLKNVLFSRAERKRVESLLEEHGKLSPERLQAGAKRIAEMSAPERARTAARFLYDLMRLHCDLAQLAALNSALELVHLVSSEKIRELSSINSTLYEFLLPEEQKPAEERVCGHVILKADVRDSTTLTRTLMDRSLNPASFFSLNFYDPVSKLLPRYRAEKVFIEGDAIILALYEQEGDQSFAVARTCVLAREIMEIVHAANEHSKENGLPALELGIGICYQDSPPLYLMDGNHHIMISRALNESDRLASCTKSARRFLDGRDTMFNVFRFQPVDDEDAAGAFDEFLLSYNVGGIHLNEAAFQRLAQEITLRECRIQLPMPWGPEQVRLFRGTVPVAPGLFHELTVREGSTAQIQARGFTLIRRTDRHYYEICTSAALDEMAQAALLGDSQAEQRRQ